MRLIIAAGVVALYMALGWLLRLDPNAYLLLGIPLLLVFQLGVARRPLTELWLKHPPARFITWPGLLAAVPFLIVPVWSAVGDWRLASWAVRLWYLAAIAGTIPLGATLVRATLKTWRELLGCLLTAGVFYVVMVVAVTFAFHQGKFHVHHDSGRILAKWFLLYLPICFVVEEVFFRGGIDSYVQREGDPYGWATAIIVSCLWGWWHMPTVPMHNVIEVMGVFIGAPLLMCMSGIPFSIFWRRSGTLLVTATLHALIDGVRNALL